MSNDEVIAINEDTKEVRVVHISQRRLDIRRFIASGIAVVILYLLIKYHIIDIRTLKVIFGGAIGAILGLIIGYIKAPRPDYYIEISTNELYNRIDVRLVPKHLRAPREPSIPTVSEGGSTVYIVTSDELAELGLSELNVRRDELRALARRVMRLQKTLTERLTDVEIEATRKARELFERYLRLRRKLYEEAIESPKREVEGE